jgi:transposase
MSTKLNQNQLLAIPLVAQGVSGKNVAKKIQVTEETVSRWKKLPEFQAEVNALLKECRDETQHKLRSLVNTALEVVKDELENKNSDQRITIALKILQNMKLNTYLYEEIGSSKAESVKSKMWNEDFAEKFI